MIVRVGAWSLVRRAFQRSCPCRIFHGERQQTLAHGGIDGSPGETATTLGLFAKL
jgi:hypothetical protein